MSEAKNDGGPAFPGPSVAWQSTGMTLRDYFASRAMVGFAADPSMYDPERMSKMAYEWADAMLKARQQ